MAAEQETENERLVSRAVKLFTFLGRAQQLLVKPVRTVDKFENAMWFADLPDHDAIHSAHRVAELTPDTPILTVDRVAKLDPPPLPHELIVWVDGAIDDTEKEPTLREAIFREEPVPAEERQDGAPKVVNRRIDIAEHPGVSEAFDAWLTDWRLWADRERRDAAVREVYKDLFAVHLKAADHSEEFELVLGVGCLAWRPDNHDQVQRHVATAPIAISFDENSGRLTVTQVSAPDAVSIEVDMLDAALISSPAKLDEIKVLAAEYDGHLLDQPAIGEICRRLIHRLDADAQYDEDAVQAPSGPSPRGAFAPAIILRRRTNRGMVQIYEQIVTQIQQAGEVPKGILPLVDPNRQPEPELSTDVQGAVVTVDDEDFLPLPVNDKQRQIIERVDSRAQTVVQGPPGTGKTHTAAALVSHLLAQGKRVLITAHTDRALKEVRGKLPREIQSLAVAVIGQSRSDMADLRTAVDNISRRADDFDPADSQRSIARHLSRIDDLRRQRAALRDRLLKVRRQEVEPRTDGPAQGTLAAIAYGHLQHEADYEWIRAFEVDPAGAGTTVSTEEIQRWRAVLRDQDVTANEPEATSTLPDAASLTTPEDFANLVAAEQQAAVRKDQFGELLSHESFGFVRSLTTALRDELRARVSNLAEQAGNLERRQEAWMNDALHDVRSGRHQTWVARSTQVKSLAETAAALTRRIGPTTSVVVADGDFGVHQQVAKSLLAHVESGSGIKTRPDGSPKIGAFTSKTVKLAEPFFAAVKINDLPATTKEQLATFIDWVDASRTVAALDQAWPVNVLIPQEDTLDEKIQWHVTEVAQLDKVLALGDQLEVERQWFQANNLPVPDWNKLEDIRRYADLVEAATAADDAVAAATPVERLYQYLRSQAQLPTPPPITMELVAAVRDRDVDGYAAAHARLHHLYDVARAVADRDRIRHELDRSASMLASAIAADPAAAEWDSRLGAYEQAWQWEMTGRWILAQDSEDANALKVSLNAIEDQIRSEVEHLAAERAWGHAVAPDRLTGAARANLTQYAQLVSRLGKGTGKYAAKQRVAIAEAMDRCRPSVPVWIMPLYRIAEQVHVEPNLYDVVIVDEASQAGLEASFLQYLAPKMVVIGDDKQVSPSAVGVDQQQLRDLANMYLSDDPYRESWLDPKRSYFDEANMRFGGRITLTEHRRCVPEIIGFSNHIAYEPEGIRLVPVRQFGAERLEPIKVVYLPDGYEAPNKTNLVEAEAIVDQIRKCLVEPEYDGATFGVISLLGKEQAKLIEGKLMDAVPPEEWAARELRCGDASDFQGSERDVMFLSMVKAPEEGKRMGVLTQQQYVQRFNVAASRAKDQMWVYHSMPREALTNSECMRFQLLDYCYGTAARLRNDDDNVLSTAVPEDIRVPPFDSLFEQRIFNRLIDRGYTVMPQVEAMGYRIDMVVTGAKGRLAIECDGDFWHGPEQYEVDLARQRELERCGWEFHRIRESVFYADMPGTLRRLWDTLDELDIRTADWVDPDFDDDDVDDSDDVVEVLEEYRDIKWDMSTRVDDEKVAPYVVRGLWVREVSDDLDEIEKICKRTEADCWLAPSATAVRCRAKGDVRKPLDLPKIGLHRWAWCVANGFSRHPVPTHLIQVRRRCDSKKCCNPAHLYASSPGKQELSPSEAAAVVRSWISTSATTAEAHSRPASRLVLEDDIEFISTLCQRDSDGCWIAPTSAAVACRPQSDEGAQRLLPAMAPHRWTFMVDHGYSQKPLPGRLFQVRRRCGKSACCRPDHLYLTAPDGREIAPSEVQAWLQAGEKSQRAAEERASKPSNHNGSTHAAGDHPREVDISSNRQNPDVFDAEQGSIEAYCKPDHAGCWIAPAGHRLVACRPKGDYRTERYLPRMPLNHWAWLVANGRSGGRIPVELFEVRQRCWKTRCCKPSHQYLTTIDGVELTPEEFDKLVTATDDNAREEAVADWDVADAIGEALAQLDPRAVEILRERFFADDRVTLEKLGERYNLTRERVRQVEVQARGALMATIIEDGQLATLVAHVRELIGSVRTIEDLLAVIPTLGIEIERVGQPAWRVLDRLDDAYEIKDGWCVAPTMAAALELTRTQLAERANQHGVVRLGDLDLVQSSQPEQRTQLTASWLTHCGYVVQDNVVLTRTSSVGDYAAALLYLEGSPLSAQEIVGRFVFDRSHTSLRNALGADDRFERVDRDRWALKDWGLEAYNGIRSMIRELVERGSGRAKLDDVVEYITARYSVSGSSVIAYASAAPFTTKAGIVRLGEGRTVRRTPQQTRRLFRRPDGWAFRVRIGTDHLRGSGFVAPMSVTTILDLAQGETVQLDSRLGAQAVAWTGLQPQFGTIRRFLLDEAVAAGTEAFLVIRDDRTFSFEQVRELVNAPLSDALALIGAQPTSDPEQARIAFATAIGLPETAPVSSIIGDYRSRGDDDIADLLLAVKERLETSHVPTDRQPSTDVDEVLDLL